MPLAGKLEDFGLPVVLQLLASTEATGRLTLTRRNGHGLVVVRDGRIAYAASNDVRETIGSLLVSHGIIDEATLADALERLYGSDVEQRLGSVLVALGRVSPEAIEEVVVEQITRVVADLARWPRGFFRFDALEIEGDREVEVDARDFLVTHGLNVSDVLFEALARLAETPGEAEPEPAALAGSSGEAGVVPMRTLIDELPSPRLHGEMGTTLLRLGRDVVERGVLFLIQGDAAERIGSFGVPEAPAGTPRPRLPLAGGSLLAEVVERGEPFHGPIEASAANAALVTLLGGQLPPEAVLAPLRLGRDVALLFYGDNAPGGRPIGSTEALERGLVQVGLRIEREQLEARVRRFEGAEPAEPR
jgi:hypothetical protein